MEPEGSLPCSQQPSTGPYPEPDRSSPYHPILSLYTLLCFNPLTILNLEGSVVSYRGVLVVTWFHETVVQVTEP
jgi:hypothetical protein